MAATIRRYGAQRDEMATIACASELRGCAHTFGWISLWLLLLRFYGVNVVRRCVLFRITFHTHRLFESCTSNKVSGFHGIVFVFLFVIFLTFSFFVVFFAWQTWLANAKPENIWRMVQCSIAIRLDCWAKTNFECVTACVCLCVCVLCWRQHFRSPKQLKWAHAVCVCVCSCSAHWLFIHPFRPMHFIDAEYLSGIMHLIGKRQFIGSIPRFSSKWI